MEAKEQRIKLFQHLDGVLGRAEKKAKNKNLNDAQKQAWNRIIIQAVSAYGKILSTEELEQRVEDLEEKLKTGVLIPNGNKQ